ncbi:MAG: hypothetical protein HYV97_19945 [Bdellovibrio sp.]|nr:hypothetical protein [Bdellovibrio sp.]
MHIGLLTSNDHPKLTPDDQILYQYLESQESFTVTPIIWNSEFNPKKYDVLIIRSVWDYQSKVDDFLLLLEKIEKAKICCLNSVDTIRGNIDKMYLFDLENENNIAIPATQIISGPKARLNIQSQEMVLKPTLSASGKNTFHITREKVLEKFIELHSAGDRRVYLAQEFIPGIFKGEISIIKFGPYFSHSVVKKPLANEFKIHGGSVDHFDVPKELHNEVEKLSEVTDSLLYSRSDWVLHQDRYYLMELELFEPELFFRFNPKAKELFLKRLNELVQTA